MNFSQLEYLLSLHKLKHFGLAAKENFVTQPTLSMMIKKLEEELEIQIFDRSSNPIKTTEIGLKIIDQAKVILSERRKLIDLTKGEIESMEGEVSIAIIPTLAPYVLPIILPLIQTQFPSIQLTIIEATTASIIEQLIDDRIDCALLATPLAIKEITEHPLFKEAFFLYSDDESHVEEINPNDINMDRLILLEEGHCLRSQALNLCNRKDQIPGNTLYKIGSIETVMNLVNQGHGLTIIPELAVHQLSNEHKHKVKKLKAPVPVRQISLVHHRTFHKKKWIENLAVLIQSVVQKSLDLHINSKIIPI